MKQNTHNRRSSLNSGEIMMLLAGAMFCLVLITTAMMGGLYARYVSTDASSDSARVIRFGNIAITETGDFVSGTSTMPIAPGVPIEKEARVVFSGSESATYVFLEVTLSDGWTANNGQFSKDGKLTWQIAGGWMPLGDCLFYRALVPNESLNAPIILDNEIDVASAITNSELTGLQCSISFRASVVQSNGFASVEAAWASLQAKEVTP